MSERTPSAHGWTADACTLRQEAIHPRTRQLVDTDGELVLEDLDLAWMQRSIGRRALRRSVVDAGLGRLSPMLGAKTEHARGRLFIADRFFASTKTHYGCGGILTGPKLAKLLPCEACGDTVARDEHAATHLRDWPERTADPGAVGASAPLDPGPPSGATDGGSDDRSPDETAYDQPRVGRCR